MTVRYIWENTRKITCVERLSKDLVMATYMLVIIEMIKEMAMVLTCTETAAHTVVDGKMVNNMEQGFSYWKSKATFKFEKENGSTAREQNG